ncbi:hypothetical protein Q3G72_026601 [Acer saccharum]|nr:hypothetical protein Q3G72_026601 [Acer saccharum]
MFQQEAESEGVQPNVNPSLQPNHESGGVQPNVNPSLQPNLDSVPRAGSSEEPQLSQPQSAADGGVQPNVNPGGSAHHPQLTETQSAPNEIARKAFQHYNQEVWRIKCFNGSKDYFVKLFYNWEAEEITFTFRREWKNDQNETPKDVFRTAHTKLAEEGEKWMKDTANSCMLVSTLIATVLFAAAFTVPGGNSNDNGIAIFLRTNAFMIFAISDALGLFSSLTSLLMFLAILTARYEIDDFLESLPKKLIIGLGSLFIAIAAMIIAFGATLTIVLSERWLWVFVPITLVASFPVAIFVMLQLPLFIQMVWSTYGASIFRPWPSKKIE